MATKTNIEFVKALQNVVDNFKTVYMWGVFGSPVTENVIKQKASQYPSWYTSARQASFRKLIGQNYFAFDCVCLIKGLLWGWNGDASKAYGGAAYATNGVPDISADSMITKCTGLSTDFSKIEVGEAVWVSGHIGVYIGNGKVIECTPSWSNNVQVTAVKNIGTIAGLNARLWTKHGKLPYISYLSTDDNTTQSGGSSDLSGGNTVTGGIAIGDVVKFAGGSVYSSSTATKAATTKVASECEVTAIANGKARPYHLISKDGAGVYGWVDATSIVTSTTGLTVGDKVKVASGAKTYTGGNLAAFVIQLYIKYSSLTVTGL